MCNKHSTLVLATFFLRVECVCMAVHCWLGLFDTHHLTCEAIKCHPACTCRTEPCCLLFISSFFFYLMTNVGIQITTIVSKEENSKSLPQKCCCQSSKQEIKKIKTENVSTMRGRGERERESSFQSVHTLAEMAPRYGDSTRFWANPFQSRTVRGQKGSSLHDVQSCKRWYAWLCLLLSALPACQACVNIEEYVRGDCLSSFLEC